MFTLAVVNCSHTILMLSVGFSGSVFCLPPFHITESTVHVS